MGGLLGCSPAAQRQARVNAAVRAPLDPDIIKLITYYPNNPFMSFDAQGDPNPEGFKVTLYAISAGTHKGAYADGVIRFKMYVVHDPISDRPVGQLVKSWEFDPDEAMGWRVSRKTRLGWPYMFYLNWGDAAVHGREVRIVPEFVRRDGQVVRGSHKSIRVPVRKYAVELIDPPREQEGGGRKQEAEKIADFGLRPSTSPGGPEPGEARNAEQ